MSQSRVIVFSCDAMVWEDVEYLLTKPRFKELFESGSAVKRMRTIYPSVTYPCHTSMSTGAYPNKHGVTNNTTSFKLADGVRGKLSVENGELVYTVPRYFSITVR